MERGIHTGLSQRTTARGYMEFLKDMFHFLMERKKWWLVPVILVLLLIGALLVFAGQSAVAPFIYTLF